MSNNIFDCINNIVFFKKEKEIHEDNMPLPPYMLQRWISMSDKDVNTIINITSNRWLFSLPKKVIYNFYMSCIPKQKRHRIEYFKKTSSKEEKDQESNLHAILEISKREYNSNKEILDLLHTKYE